MADPILFLYAIINVVVTALFAWVVLLQYVQRRRLYQLYWAIALLMAFLATLAYVFMFLVHPTSSGGIVLFRLYYILGAALTSAWLGLGSIALVTSTRFTRISLGVLCALSLLAVVFIATARINTQQLSQIAGTAGAGIFQPTFGAWTITIIVLNTLGVVAVVGVAIYSGWRLLRRQGKGNLLWGNILILAGDLLNAYAGVNANQGIKNLFWLIMALGWTVFFSGVLLASRAHRYTVTTKEKSQEQYLRAQ